MVENWVAQIISWLPELFWLIFKRYLFLVISTKFACFLFNHVPIYRELGRPLGEFGGNVGSPDRIMGRIWRLGDRLSTALIKIHKFRILCVHFQENSATQCGIAAILQFGTTFAQFFIVHNAKIARMYFHTVYFNPLWPSDATWRHRTVSTLAQVMACYLMAPSHYLNQFWLLISMIHHIRLYVVHWYEMCLFHLKKILSLSCIIWSRR